MIYLKLCLSFLQVGLFSIGGGYAAIPLIRNQAVDVNGWLSLNGSRKRKLPGEPLIRWLPREACIPLEMKGIPLVDQRTVRRPGI